MLLPGNLNRSRLPFLLSRAICPAAAAAIALVLISASPPALALGESSDPFCQGSVARDYTAPLQRLPDVREVPDGERLGFAPRGVKVAGPGSALVRSGEGRLLQFSDEASTRRGARLGWYVTSHLARVDRRGRAVRVVKRRRQRAGLVEKIDEQLFGFARVPASPGLYLWATTFRDRRGRMLGRYGEYVRVVRPRLEVTLRLNADVFNPGDLALARIENLGTEWISYGHDFSIERYDGSDWVRVDLDLVFILIPILAEPGTVGPCNSTFRIPNDFEPGRYRMVKQVERARLQRVGRILVPAGRPFTVNAEFDVVP